MRDLLKQSNKLIFAKSRKLGELIYDRNVVSPLNGFLKFIIENDKEIIENDKDESVNNLKGELYGLLMNMVQRVEKLASQMMEAGLPALVASDLARLQPIYMESQVSWRRKGNGSQSFPVGFVG